MGPHLTKGNQVAKNKHDGELAKNQGLNSGIPEHRGPDDETKRQLQARLDRSGEAEMRGGIRTMQNLADGTVEAEERQRLSEEMKVEDVEAAEKAAKSSTITEVTAK